MTPTFDVSTSRRTFLQIAGVSAAVPAVAGAAGRRPGGPGDPGTGSGVALGATVPEATELTPFRDPLVVPPVIRPDGDGVTEIEMVEANVRLHSQLPPTRMWTYAGHFPGPTVEVRRGQRVRVAWTNRLQGTSPVQGAWAQPEGPQPGLLPYNIPGAQGGTARPEVAAVTPWTTVHLHGGRQHAASDGAADYGVAPGGTQLAEYPNDMAAAAYFYHDHAMLVTSLNVMSGLVGGYVVRDDREDRLGLPSGRHEIPLMVTDTNFGTDAEGRIDGRLLAKRVLARAGTKPVAGRLAHGGTFLGPFTMVNGVVWPHLDVEARCYRFRITNVSMNRPYRFAVVDEKTGAPVAGAMTLVGTDGGLLGAPVRIPETLTLAPAERVDVLIDFAAHPGKHLNLVNTLAGRPSGTAVPTAGLPYPQVMQFRVDGAPAAAYKPPATLAADFRRLTAADVPKGTTERYVLLTFAKEGMPEMWELEKADAGTAPGDGVVKIALAGGTQVFRRTATTFDDRVGFLAAPRAWETWHFLNVAPATRSISHPMHIHLMAFQVLSRRSVDGGGMDTSYGGTRKAITLGKELALAPEDSGWKDTVNVPLNTMVTVAGRFGPQTGRFMYHCHALDHEDEGMMRPLTILPDSVLALHHMMGAMSDPA